MRNIVFTKAYQKDFRRVIQQYSKNKREGINKELNDILEKIGNDTLSVTENTFYKVHALIGDKLGIWEFHFRNDICVEYTITDTEIRVLRIGSHSAIELTSIIIAKTLKRLNF